MILLPLRPASLTHKNPQRRKTICAMLPIGRKDRSEDVFVENMFFFSFYVLFYVFMFFFSFFLEYPVCVISVTLFVAVVKRRLFLSVFVALYKRRSIFLFH